METKTSTSGSKVLQNLGLGSLFDTELDIKIRVLSIVALAGAVGNTLGFLANLFLYGFNTVTAFCAFCAVLIILYLFIGMRSKYSTILGYSMLFILAILEFPLLTLTYGAVMYPYLIIGFHALSMISEKRRRIIMCSVLGVYDVAIIVYSSINPYIFGPQDSAGLLGSAVITFIISIITVASLVIMWQSVYLVETIEIDSITKVQSQVGFNKNAAKILRSDYHSEFTLLYFNICSFKAINSIFGIDGGNQFLFEFADRLSHSPLNPRLVGRLNSDKFVCLVEQKNLKLEYLDDICQIPFGNKGRQITAIANCGVYDISNRFIPVSSMCDRGNAALKYIHSSGNKFYAVYDKKAESSFHQETDALGEIDRAITERQFQPFYQPIIDCQTKKIVSAEALARWIHPDRGIISPAVFIPVLEKKELVSKLDSIIAEKVNELIQSRLFGGKKIVPISVNLSRTDLYDRDMMGKLHRMVQSSENNDYWYRFEITESAYEDMSDYTLTTLSDLRKSGAVILVDDFGSGYSSLGMITDYAFDVIKLDMQFARKIESSEKIVGVVQSLIDMAHTLGAKVIAEGIETEAQFNTFKECGCDYIQGYYFYKPLSEKDFLALLDSQK